MGISRKRVTGLTLDISAYQFEPRIDVQTDHVSSFSRAWDDLHAQRMVAVVLKPRNFEVRCNVRRWAGFAVAKHTGLGRGESRKLTVI